MRHKSATLPCSSFSLVSSILSSTFTSSTSSIFFVKVLLVDFARGDILETTGKTRAIGINGSGAKQVSGRAASEREKRDAVGKQLFTIIDLPAFSSSLLFFGRLSIAAGATQGKIGQQ